jgi:signal transduction histidine kinase
MPQADEGQLPERYPERAEPKSSSWSQISPLSRHSGGAQWFESLPGRLSVRPPFRDVAAATEMAASRPPAELSARNAAQSPIVEITRVDRTGPLIPPPPRPLPESISELIHDARNMVSALELYCDLLEEPGVLSHPCRHYAQELRRIGAANRRLLQGLSSLDSGSQDNGSLRNAGLDSASSDDIGRQSAEPSRFFAVAEDGSPVAKPLEPRLRARWRSDRAAYASASQSSGSLEMGSPAAVPIVRDKTPDALARDGRRRRMAEGQIIRDLACELEANRNLLTAIVGHAVTLGMSIRGGARPVAMSSDDLTRVLVNLAKNAAEAMPGGGHLQISLEEGAEYLTLSFTDTGPGIPVLALESIFSPGFSTHIGIPSAQDAESSAWPVQHRGLGLSIVRSLVTAAGGAVWAANRIRGTGNFEPAARGAAESGQAATAASTTGAVILVEFPLVADGS